MALNYCHLVSSSHLFFFFFIKNDNNKRCIQSRFRTSYLQVIRNKEKYVPATLMALRFSRHQAMQLLFTLSSEHISSFFQYLLHITTLPACSHCWRIIWLLFDSCSFLDDQLFSLFNLLLYSLYFFVHGFVKFQHKI